MSPQDTLNEQPTQTSSPPHFQTAGGIVIGLVLIIGIGLSLGGEAGHFIETGAQYFPFIPLALLGVLGLKNRWAQYSSYIYGLWIHASVIFFAMSLALVTVAEGPLIPFNPEQELSPGALSMISQLFLTLCGLFLVNLLVLLRPVRATLSRWLPIDPDNLTHTLALWIILFITVSGFIQLAFLGGQPPLLTAINNGTIPMEEVNARSPTGQKLDLVYGLLWLIPLVLLSAGWPLKRHFVPTLRRLGLMRPTWKQVLFALLAAVVLAVKMPLIGHGLSAIWHWLGWPETDAAAFEQLLGATFSPLGALVIGVTAGLGEELAVRGLLQPRLGILLSNLAFTSFHTYQYGLDALIIVFLLGSILGIIRARSNTTTAAIVHGCYNMFIVLANTLVS